MSSEASSTPIIRAALPQARDTLFNIHALRGLAAMLVVFCHANVWAERHPWSIATGANGVDLFFVISGFIMVFTTRLPTVTAPLFVQHRLIRVVPLYWLITLLVFCLVAVMPALFKGTRADFGELLLSLAFIPFMKSSGIAQPMVFVGWTLNYEMFFYALFACGLLLRNRLIGTLAVIGALAVLVLVGQLWAPAGVIPHFYTQPLIAEFAYGMLLGLWWRRVGAAPWVRRLACCGLVLGLTAFLFGSREILVVGNLGYGLLAALIVGTALVLEACGQTLRWSWLERPITTAIKRYLQRGRGQSVLAV